MKRSAAVFCLSIIFCLALSLAAHARTLRLPAGEVEWVKRNENHVEVRTENVIMRFSGHGPGLLRIQAGDDNIPVFPSYAVVGAPAPSAPDLDESENEIAISTGMFIVTIDKKTGTMDVSDKSGVLVSEPGYGGIIREGRGWRCIKEMPADEHYYGFGEKSGPLDKRGQKMVMWNTDAYGYGTDTDPLYQSHPFFMAVRNGRAYGLFFDNTWKTEFDMGASEPGRFSFYAPDGEFDYWIIGGPTPKEVITRYGKLVGRMPLPPKWGLGFHQCRYSYVNEKEVRDVMAGFDEHDIPVSAIYFDIHYMRGYRVFTFNKRRFPDPAGLMSDMEEQGIKSVVIVDPGIKIDKKYGPYNEGIKNGYLCMKPDGEEPFTAYVWPGKVHFPDFHQPEARQWWGDLHQFYTDLGVDGIWNDMNEPAGWGRHLNLGFVSFGLGGKVNWDDMTFEAKDGGRIPHGRLHNVYGSLESIATYEGMKELIPGERPFVITRAGYAGVQRNALIWTGDNTATWDHLRLAVPMQLNMGMSGLTWVGGDIGGFDGSPSPEMFARWMQAGVFSPFCRNHTRYGTKQQEPWVFGDKVTDISREAILTRLWLMPYTYSTFEESTRNNLPVQRAMLLEFPNDENTYNIDDQFMWGKWIMVAPVVEDGARERPVYFPKGKWYGLRDGKVYEGPGIQTVKAPLSKTPIFAREGAIIPTDPSVMGEEGALEIHVYPSDSPSRFMLYEDDGISFDYRDGDYLRTAFTQGPSKDGLSVEIGKPEGEFEPQTGKWKIIVHGLDEVRELKRDGKAKTVVFSK